MCLAAYTLLRDASQTRSPDQLHVSAVTGCRLAVLSSVLIGLSGLGCLHGEACVLGYLMIFLGLAGAAAGGLFLRRHLAERDSPSARRARENPSVQ
jgi:hypothetical protein